MLASLLIRSIPMEGYHQFKDPEPHGSFEVFYNGTGDEQVHVDELGWYWWACFPGCMPDGDPMGPFKTAKEAYDDAIGS